MKTAAIAIPKTSSGISTSNSTYNEVCSLRSEVCNSLKGCANLKLNAEGVHTPPPPPPPPKIYKKKKKIFFKKIKKKTKKKKKSI